MLGAVSPPSRRGTHVLYLPGFGKVKTKQKVDESWDMRSFRLVNVTHRTTCRTQPKDHVFELHVSVRFTPPKSPKTGNMRGIDVGGKHLAITNQRCAGHHMRRQEKALVMCTIVYNSHNMSNNTKVIVFF